MTSASARPVPTPNTLPVNSRHQQTDSDLSHITNIWNLILEFPLNLMFHSLQQSKLNSKSILVFLKDALGVYITDHNLER